MITIWAHEEDINWYAWKQFSPDVPISIIERTLAADCKKFGQDNIDLTISLPFSVKKEEGNTVVKIADSLSRLNYEKLMAILMNKETMEVAIQNGGPHFLVDISKEACQRSGFENARYGSKFISPVLPYSKGNKFRGRLAGVAPAEAHSGRGGKDVMWFFIEGHDSDIFQWEGKINLKEEGFELIE